MTATTTPPGNPARRIERATPADIPGIVALIDANQPEHGGTLSARLSPAQLARLLDDLPLVVARDGPRVVGALLAASKATLGEIPIVRAMLAAYAGGPDAYVYGPIVVAADQRGRGLAAEMAQHLKTLLPGRDGILFIRSDNPASLRAHEKLGAVPRGHFLWEGQRIEVLSLPS